MCGLLLTNLTHKFSQLIASLSTMNHRGPDSKGYMLYNDLFFGHTRLAITGSKGTQPFFQQDSVICIVNGEFYDYENIKRELILSGSKFKTDSDSEILLHLYIKYGIDCLSRLNGEFAFILYDIQKNVVYSSRDRFGTKPLYFYKKDLNFIFTSSLDTIKELVCTFTLDEDILKFVQTLQYLPQTRTLFNDINQVKPAHYIEYNLTSNTYDEKMYWSRPSPSSIVTHDINHLKDLMTNSIKKRIPNIPYACHLSGGIDSSLISIIANQHTNTTAYSVNFTDDNFYSEYKFAEQTAIENDINLIEVPVSLDDIYDNLEKAIYQSNGISINGHIVAKYLLNQEINKSGIKVSLSGEGSDEIFYGYSHFNQTSNFNKSYLTGIQLPSENQLDLSSITLDSVPTWIKAKSSIGHRLFSLSNLEFSDDTYSFFVNEYLQSTNINTNNKLLLAADTWSKYALNDYLLKTLDDSMSMNFSIEGRIPFLDKDVVEYAALFNIQDHFDNVGGKSLLRNMFKDVLPKHIIDKPKQSFMSPSITHLLKNEKHRKYFTDLILTSKISNYYNTSKLLEFLNSDLCYSDEPPLMIILSLAILSNKFL